MGACKGEQILVHLILLELNALCNELVKELEVLQEHVVSGVRLILLELSALCNKLVKEVVQHLDDANGEFPSC